MAEIELPVEQPKRRGRPKAGSTFGYEDMRPRAHAAQTILARSDVMSEEIKAEWVRRLRLVEDAQLNGLVEELHRVIVKVQMRAWELVNDEQSG